MRKHLTILTFIATVLLTATPAHSNEGKQMTEDQQKILTTVKGMTESFHAGDLEGIMDHYETTAAIAFEAGTTISDSAVIRQMFQGAFTLNPKFSYSGHEVMVLNDLAIHFAPWTMNGKTPDGQEITQSGLSVSVLRKQSDGNWLLVIDNPHGHHLMQRD